MIKDLSPRDTQKLVDFCINKLYAKTIEQFKEAVRDIATRNQQIKQSVLFSFTFNGKLYRFENGVIRHPKTLDSSLTDEMRKHVRRYERIVELEGAYVRQALVSACGVSESATHLYQLLPEIIHPFLVEIGVSRLYQHDFKDLPEEVVLGFQTKHKVNLDKIYHRATRNLLGLIK